MGTGESGSRRPPDRRRWFPLPDFLGIGAMRAGTSWLAEHLAKHPEISMPRKEIHFFNRRFDRQLIPLLPRSVEARMRYRARFVGAGLSGRLTGEFTPAYALLDPDRIATVHEWMPRARLLFIMRDPVDRAWSQAKHDYAGWLGRDAATAPEEELRAFFARPRVQQRADYATSLENWLRCFDRGQLFMTFLEHVKADPAPVLRDVFAFLGVSSDVDLGDDVVAPVHASVRSSMPAWAREHLEQTLRPLDPRLEALVGSPLPWRHGTLA